MQKTFVCASTSTATLHYNDIIHCIHTRPIMSYSWYRVSMGLYCEDIDTMLRIDLHVIRQIIYANRSILNQKSIVDKSSSRTMLIGSNEGNSTTNMNMYEPFYP